MEIEFDPAKDVANFVKHGVRLAFGARVFDDPALTISATVREGGEEERLKAIGFVDGNLYTAVHVWRGDAIRFISVRRSNRGEQRFYYRAGG